jgi:DNA-binding CsgD family transcriptional regulator
LTGAGHIHLAQGDPARAAASFRESLPLFRDVGDPLGQAAAVRAIGALAAHVGRFDGAARLLAAATAKRATHGAGLAPSERRQEARAIELAQAALGEAAFAGEWDVGRSLSWEAACAEALALSEALDQTSAALPEVATALPAPDPVPGSRAMDAFNLTRRECEVLVLLCVRMTDSQIAERLFLSPRTVESHVANILRKLGVANRRDAAALAARLSLV